MAYKYEEVRRGAGTFVNSTEMAVDDPLGLAQFEEKRCRFETT